MIRLRTVLATGLLILVAFLVLPPFVMLFIGSIWGAPPGAPGRLSLQAYFVAFTEPYTYRVIANSLYISLAKTALATIWGVALAWLVTRTDIPFRRTMEVLIPVQFFIPSIFNVFAYLIFFNPNTGLANVALMEIFGLTTAPLNLYSYGGMIFVMAIGSTAFVFVLTYGAFRGLDPALEESARACGAGTVETLVRITVPLVAPAILGALILSFISGIEAFEAPVLIGSPAGIFVFTNEIYRAISFFDPPRYGVATALGVSVILLTFFLVAIQWSVLGQRQYFTITGKGYNPRLIRLGRWRWLGFTVGAVYVLVAVILPVGQLLFSSMQSVLGVYSLNSLTLNNYREAFLDPIIVRALRNTVLLASMAAFFGIILSALVAYVVTRTQFRGKRWLDLLCWLPWTIPGIVLAIGMLWAYLTIPGLWIFYGTLWILLIAYILNGLPLGVRAVSGTMVQVHRELEDCARVHGVTWLRTFCSIVLPLIAPGLLAAGIFFAYIAVRTLGSVILLYGYGTEVLSIVMLQFWAERTPQLVSVLAIVMLSLVTLLSAIQRWLLFKGRQPAQVRRGEKELEGAVAAGGAA
ncbi:MAG: ABC transporter permease [Candidatus Binatia bacterium]